MQRQKRQQLSVRSLRRAVSVATLIRPAANSNQPDGAPLALLPAPKPGAH
jgi:hypothetical protein